MRVEVTRHHPVYRLRGSPCAVCLVLVLVSFASIHRPSRLIHIYTSTHLHQSILASDHLSLSSSPPATYSSHPYSIHRNGPPLFSTHTRTRTGTCTCTRNSQLATRMHTTGTPTLSPPCRTFGRPRPCICPSFKAT